MQFLTARTQPQSATMPSTPTVANSSRRGLTATWFLLDGKLVCKWFPVESESLKANR